jgi:hypothetical protein
VSEEKTSRCGPAAARTDIAALLRLAAAGLAPMLDPEQRQFCYRLNRTEAGLVREGISQRYTIMTLLGLRRFEASGGETPREFECVLKTTLEETEWIESIGDAGLMVWLAAVAAPERLEETYTKLRIDTALERFADAREGPTMEMAWLLAGLAQAAATKAPRLTNLQDVMARTYSLLKANQGSHGFFGHQAQGATFTSNLRRRIGSFADQVYPIHALSHFAKTCDDRDALKRAERCAEAICEAQGPMGQWWWHYDASSGRVFQRYPVYSVHQHGMAPMALLALSAAGGSDFRGPVYKGLQWIDGNNELDQDMREPSAQIVWRNIHRRGRRLMYGREFLDFLRNAPGPVTRDELAITYECRPYELGWLLYAFSGHDCV